MPRRPDAEEPINTPVQTRGKATQLQRLHMGMITAANRDGYAGASVTAVVREAGVSRPTFYEYFEDRDDCFVKTAVDVRERLDADVRGAVGDSTPGRALMAAVGAMVAFARAQPAQAQFLMKEVLAGGPQALDARDKGLEAAAKIVAVAEKDTPRETASPDLPVAAVLGATQRMLASRLRRSEGALADVQHDLDLWVESYEQPRGQHRWDELKALRAPPRSPHLPAAGLRPPGPLSPGRPRLSRAEIVENHRQRIMFATAQVVQEHGYTRATVSDITGRASVDGRGFYRIFADKEEAFSAIHELGFQYLMAVTARAFFAGNDWPERIWEAFRAATQSIDDTPTFAHVAFVEAYAVGPRGIQRVDDSHIAFTIFLQEGYRCQSEGAVPPQLALEAIMTTIFEIIYRRTRASATPETARVLAHLVHLCLVPFLGSEAANKFIDARLAASSAD
jgi:AcrR family transcriptional regulator